MNVTCYVALPFVMADDGVGFSRASLTAPARSRAAGPDIWRVVTSATPS
jgi:hypothetical protein